MNKTFIDMLTAINEPEAIERAYQIMAAKRDLLAYKVKPTFKHTAMEPKPLVAAPQPRTAQEAFKLMPPSLADIMPARSVQGEYLIRLKGVTAGMQKQGFHNGMVFKLLQGGYEKSTLRHVRSGKVARISNQFLEPFFKPTHPSQLPVNNTDF